MTYSGILAAIDNVKIVHQAIDDHGFNHSNAIHQFSWLSIYFGKGYTELSEPRDKRELSRHTAPPPIHPQWILELLPLDTYVCVFHQL